MRNQNARHAQPWCVACLLMAGVASGAQQKFDALKQGGLVIKALDQHIGTGQEVQYEIRAKGNRVRLLISSGSKEVEYLMFMDSGTVRKLYRKQKIYAEKLVGGLQNLPLAVMLKQYTAQGPDKLQEEAGYKGTLYADKALVTKIVSVQETEVKEEEFTIPRGWEKSGALAEKQFIDELEFDQAADEGVGKKVDGMWKTKSGKKAGAVPNK
jgi:hypothetical protein